MPIRTAVALNVAALVTIAIGLSALLQAPAEVRSMVLPWPVVQGLFAFAALANIVSIVVLAVRAMRRPG
ncbi:MAG: hypothetical protein JXB46_11415 [Candidatus Eisenbacteria bacterium]|nr:hypothetical protein [Candidatus Eisenbacteria bacterium]